MTVTPSIDEPKRIYTVGHSTRSAEELLAILADSGVQLVADVRAFPSSRRHPQFNRGALAAWLASAGIGYRHFPALGGRRTPIPGSVNGGWHERAFQGYADHMRSEEFQRALADLDAAASDSPTAIMCAEALWWQCHRRIITDYLLAAGETVLHIVGPGKIEPGEMTEGARVKADGTVTYPALL